MEMNPSQQATALGLLQSCVSPDGFQKAQEIMEFETLL